MYKKVILVASFLLLTALSVPLIAKATSFFEAFSPPLKFKQPGDPQRPGLWLINLGDFKNGSYQYYKQCGDSSCIDRLEEGEGPNKTNYLRTTLFHDGTPGNYANMEASELQTGFSFGQGDENTHPTPEHPVTLAAKIRCSNCNLDGTGGQIGSWGLWEWNSYPEVQPDGSFGGGHPITSIGFGWQQAGGVFPGGLNIEVFKDNIPYYFVPLSFVLPSLDLTQWHTYSLTWSANSLGVESVDFYIDGNLVGSTVIPVAMPSLSQTMWHDNQLATGFDQTGKPLTTFVNPDTSQFVDVDYITVSQ